MVGGKRPGSSLRLCSLVALLVAPSTACDDPEGLGSEATEGVGDGSAEDDGDTGAADLPRCEAFQLDAEVLSEHSAGLVAECSDDDTQRLPGGAIHRAETVKCEFGGTMCETNDDCAEGETCLCRSGLTTGGAASAWSYVVRYTDCYPAGCQGDADCDEGFACALAYDSCRDPLGLYCHGADDECARDADCDQAGTGDRCAYVADDGRWECSEYIDCG